MINGDNKKPERGSNPAILGDVSIEAQRIAAALARAEFRKADVVTMGPKATVMPPSTERAAPAEKSEKPKAEPNTGFDPYNSGSFDRKHAWSRVTKR